MTKKNGKKLTPFPLMFINKNVHHYASIVIFITYLWTDEGWLHIAGIMDSWGKIHRLYH